LKSKLKELRSAIESAENSVQAALLAADEAERKERMGTLPPGAETAEQWRKEAHRQSGFLLSYRHMLLVREASEMDIEPPPDTPALEYWSTDNYYGDKLLSPKGRLFLRQAIDAENARRFEIKTMYVTKIILPIVASLVGIIGAITGLVAVITKR
jgi:hypothetical protein